VVRAGVPLLPGGAPGAAGRAHRVRDAAPPPARPAAGRPGAGVPAKLQPAWPRGARGGFLIGDEWAPFFKGGRIMRRVTQFFGAAVLVVLATGPAAYAGGGGGGGGGGRPGAPRAPG